MSTLDDFVEKFCAKIVPPLTDRERQVAALAMGYALASAAPPVEGWRPIETAPKDGTQVLLFAAAWSMSWGEVQAGHYEGDGEGGGQWVTSAGIVEDNDPGFDPDAEIEGDVILDDDYLTDINVGPTHWMPLPTQPDSQGGEDAAH